MEQWVKEILQKEREIRKLPLEVKKLNNNYYLYRSTTHWDKKEKKVKKDSDYIGRITPKGVIEKKKSNDVRSIFEYGNSELLHILAQDIIEPLKKYYYDRWKEILACSIVKTIQPLPIRLIKSRWEKLHLSQEINASLSPNTISEVLRDIGKDYGSQKELFDGLMVDSKTLIFDLSSIFSYSENLHYAEKGHNADHIYLKQINFMLFFSMEKHLPVLLKPLPGSVRDIKALKTVIDEVNAKDSTVVIDRGFASYVVPDLLKEFDFNFILPLRRNFTEIDYDRKLDYTFSYRKRGIKWGRKRIGTNFLYLFEDVRNDFLAVVQSSLYTLINAVLNKPVVVSHWSGLPGPVHSGKGLVVVSKRESLGVVTAISSPGEVYTQAAGLYLNGKDRGLSLLPTFQFIPCP